MLKAIVEQVELRSEVLLRKGAGSVTVFATTTGTPRYQQRLIAEVP